MGSFTAGAFLAAGAGFAGTTLAASGFAGATMATALSSVGSGTSNLSPTKMFLAFSSAMMSGSRASSGLCYRTMSIRLFYLNDLLMVFIATRHVGQTDSFEYQSERQPLQLRCWQGVIYTGSCIISLQMPHSSSSTSFEMKSSFDLLFETFAAAGFSSTAGFFALLLFGTSGGTSSRSFSTTELASESDADFSSF